MQAVDSNILIYAQLRSLPQFAKAHDLLKRLATGIERWAIPWPCIYEYLRVVTHPRFHHPPIPIDSVLNELSDLMASPSLIMLQEGDNHWDVVAKLVSESGASGNLVHDAHIAALCLEHGVSELFTADRDFARFPSLVVRNPFA